MTTIVTIDMGGTGATHAAGAREALSVPSITDMGQSYAQANAAYAQANAAYTHANSAYVAANNAQVTVYQNNAANVTTQKINFVNTSTITVSVSNSNGNADIALTAVGGAAYDQANAAYGQANQAYSQANNARSDSNTTFSTVNTTFGTLNTTFGTVNTTFGTVNTNYQAAYAQANTARGTANDAYAAANTKLSSSGGSISGDLAITGNLTVTGNATTINVTNLSVNDSMILLSTNAVGDSNDIGFIGHFDRGQTATHAGLIRKATENRFYLFDNYEVEPTNNVIDVAGNNFRVGNLRLGVINANSFVTSAGLDVAGQANAAYGQANAAYTRANTKLDSSGGTVTGNLTVTGTLTVSGNVSSINTQSISSVSNEIILNSNASGSPTLDGKLTINRGSSSNVTLLWNETADKWGWTDNGTTYYYFDDIRAGYAQANAAYAAANNRVLKAGDTMTGALAIQADASNEQLIIKRATNTNEQLILGFNSSDYGSIQAIEQNVAYRPLILNRDGGNVSIGTSSSLNKLHVLGSSYSSVSTGNGNFRLEGSGGNGLVFGTIDANSSYASWIQSGYVVDFNTARYNLLLQPIGGNVAIGTTTATALLTVGGDQGGTSNSALAGYSKTMVIGANNYNVGYNSGNAVMLMINSYSNDASDNVYPIYVEDENNVVDFYLYSGTDQSANTKRAYFGGNVGIGTTNPISKLRVDGDVRFITKSGSFSWDNGLNLYESTATNRWQFLNDGTNSNILRIAYNGNERIRVDTSGRVDIFGGSIYAASFIDADSYSYYVNPAGATSAILAGNVGIGTTTPNGIVHIVTSSVTSPILRMETAGNSQNTIFWMEDQDANPGAKAVGTFDLSAGLGLFNIYGGAYTLNSTSYYASTRGASRMALTDATIATYVSASSTGTAGAAVTWYQTLNMSNTDIIMYTNNGTERVRINSNGNLGVGNNAPDFKTIIQSDITKSGDINPGTAHLSLQGNSDVRKRMILGYDTNSNGFGFIKAGFFNNTWTTLSLQPDGGNVGIGTTSGAEKLHVVGNMVATGSITASYSDARFKDIISRIKNPLQIISNIDAIFYRPNELVKSKYPQQEDRVFVGVTAQSVKEVLPEVVVPSPIDPEYDTVHYERLVPVLIAAIQEQQKQIEELRNKVGL